MSGELRFRRDAPRRPAGRRVGAMAAILVVTGALLWLVRLGAAREADQPVPSEVVIEVVGEVPTPGFHMVPAPGRAHAALAAAGVEAGAFVDAQLEPGTRLVVAGGAWRAEAMAERLVFGLPIDPNTATAAGLEAIPGIGPALAMEIVADRASLGPFSSVEDLDRVKGIGPATVEAMRPFVAVSP